MTNSERLRLLIRELHETQTSFAKKIDMPQSTISNAIMRNSNLNSQIMGKIIKAYPHVNIGWLMTGHGDVFKQQGDNSIKITPGEILTLYLKKEGISEIEFAEKMGIPIEDVEKHLGLKDNNMDYMVQWAKNLGTKTIEMFMSADLFLKHLEKDEALLPTYSQEETRPRIPYTAAAGSLTSAVEGVTAEQCDQIPRIVAFPNYDFTILIKGNSMEPKYEGGDEVACKRVDNTSFIQWGKVHVLDTDQGIIIKRVYEDGDKIRCVSYNSEYPDFSIMKEEIYSMSLVVGLIRL